MIFIIVSGQVLVSVSCTHMNHTEWNYTAVAEVQVTCPDLLTLRLGREGLIVWTPDPTRETQPASWTLPSQVIPGITWLGSVQLECQGFWIQQISYFKSSTAIGQILQQIFKFSMFYSISTSCHQSNSNAGWLKWSFPHQHQQQHSSARHFWARFFPRPFLMGWVWGPD